ncbi:MAG: hypothetical protein KC731_18730 [Myxococcales bacterium]|nr:hypothetical protein [Myxococcales bacterium]
MNHILRNAPISFLLVALSGCGDIQTAPVDLAAQGLPLLVDAPTGATASLDHAQVKVEAPEHAFAITIDRTPSNIAELEAKYEKEGDRTEIVEADDQALLIRRKEMGRRSYYAFVNVKVGEDTFNCETDWQAHAEDAKVGKAMLAACRGLRPSSTPVTSPLGGGAKTGGATKAASAPKITLTSTSALGVRLQIPEGAKQLVDDPAMKKWSLPLQGGRVAVEVQLSKLGAKSEADIRRQAKNMLLGTIATVTEGEDHRFTVVFEPQGILQKLATYTPTHALVCDGPAGQRSVLEEICGSLASE